MKPIIHKSISFENRSFRSTMDSTNFKKVTPTQVKILKVREKYRPLTAPKKKPCLLILAKPTRPPNIKINKNIIQEEQFGLRQFTDGELQNLFSSKVKKKQPNEFHNQRMPEAEVYKVLRNLNYLESFSSKARVVDLIQEKRLNFLFRKAKK